MRFLLRLLINAAALWVAVRLVHGITYRGPAGSPSSASRSSSAS